MNMSLIIIEGNYGSINYDDSTCHGYYIIKFSSLVYTLQSDFNIYGQVIYSGEMVYEVTHYFPININPRYHVSPNNNSSNTTVSLRKIINANVNVIFYYHNGVVIYYFRSISQKYFSSLTPLHVPMEEHNKIMDENNQIEIISFEILVSIGTQ